MHKTWKNLLLITAVSSCALPLPTQASTDFPPSIAVTEGEFSLTAPDTDTTQSAYGGRLRVYDVHLAKMFEVTQYLCSSDRVAPGIVWSYRAGNGSIDMGNFEISCQLASDIAIAYGLGHPETTEIYSTDGIGGSRTESLNIPLLNLTGNKVDRWMRFTSQFAPID